MGPAGGVTTAQAKPFAGLPRAFLKRLATVNGAKCLSNLKQLSLVQLMYVGDNNDSFVRYYELNDAPNATWAALLTRKLGYYPVNGGIQVCPSLRGSDIPSESVNEQFVHYGYNYLHLGSNLRYGGGVYPTARLGQIANPTETILLIDCYRLSGANGAPRGDYLVYDATTADVVNFGTPHARHKGGANIGWVDGHASYRKIANPQNPWATLGQDVAPSLFDRSAGSPPP